MPGTQDLGEGRESARLGWFTIFQTEDNAEGLGLRVHYDHHFFFFFFAKALTQRINFCSSSWLYGSQGHQVLRLFNSELNLQISIVPPSPIMFRIAVTINLKDI